MGMRSATGTWHGPAPGFGATDHRPWRGIVEEAPAIWITWLVALAKLAGVPVMQLAVSVGETPIEIVQRQLTYGWRNYFRCPVCRRRCEALYLVGGHPACRTCHRLGYRSQSHRSRSWWATLDRVFDRQLSSHRRDRLDRRELVELLTELLQEQAAERITRLTEQLTITVP